MAENISFNFGAIRDTVTKLSASELIKEQKSKTLEKFLNEIKKNPILTKQQFVYKNIENAKPFQKERLAERFIAQNMKLFKNEKWDEIVSENKRIRRELLDDIHIESHKDNRLSESINTLIESNCKLDFSNFEKEQDAFDYVVKHLTRQLEETDISKEKQDHPKLLESSWKFITKIAVSNFNERYEHLNEEEKKVFSILIADGREKTSYLDGIIKENITLINSILENQSDLDNESRKLLENFKIKIENMNNVNFVNIDEYILSNIELQSLLK